MSTTFNKPQQQQPVFENKYYNPEPKGTKVLPPMPMKRKQLKLNMAQWLLLLAAIFIPLFVGIEYVVPSFIGMKAAPKSFDARTAFNAGKPNTHFMGNPSLTVDQINQILAKAGSPAAGTGQALYDGSMKTHVDDAFALAVFYAESQYGTLGVARSHKSLANFIDSSGQYVAYLSWADGYADFYQNASAAGQDRIDLTIQALYSSNAPDIALVTQKMHEYTGE